MSEQWFVVRTKQAKETTAACAIAAEGFHAFLPVQLVERSHAGKRERVSRPLFPRYLFVEFDRDVTPFGKLNYCRGVASRGLMCDAMDRPIPVPTSVIDRIRDSERAMMAKVGEATTGYRPGDTFLLQRGPYAKLEATYVGEENGAVFATVTLFGRGFLQTLSFEDVPPCGNVGNSIDKISA
jgi:transcriptional antiterminator RfaH